MATAKKTTTATKPATNKKTTTTTAKKQTTPKVKPAMDAKLIKSALKDKELFDNELSNLQSLIEDLKKFEKDFELAKKKKENTIQEQMDFLRKFDGFYDISLVSEILSNIDKENAIAKGSKKERPAMFFSVQGKEDLVEKLTNELLSKEFTFGKMIVKGDSTKIDDNGAMLKEGEMFRVFVTEYRKDKPLPSEDAIRIELGNVIDNIIK